MRTSPRGMTRAFLRKCLRGISNKNALRCAIVASIFESEKCLASLARCRAHGKHMNQWTFIDYIFVIIMIVSIGFAVIKGLAREIVSLVALIGGFMLAAFYYPSIAIYFADFTKTDAIANLIGFMIIFLGCLILGVVLAFLINRFVKMASLQWIDRLLGGVYGLIRGWALASIIVLALIAFPVREHLLARSVFAPYLLAGARTAAYLIPQKMKDDFYKGYQKVLQIWSQNRNET